MKVKELISKLQKADPEHEIYASPRVFVPVAGEGQVARVADPDRKHSIAGVVLIKDMQTEPWEEFVLITFEESEASTVRDELIN